MNQHDKFDFGPHDELGRMIGNKPYVEPDPALTQRIMDGLRPKRHGWFKVLAARLTTPMSVSFSPLTASLAVVCLILSGSLLFNARFHNQPTALSTGRPTNSVPVVFRFQAADARSVAVMGSFNRWDPKGYEMMQDPETGNWKLRVELSPGKHDYVFLVDGKTIAPDPQADISKADDFGHKNSILFVKGNNGHRI